LAEFGVYVSNREYCQMQVTVPGLTQNAILDASPIPTSVIDTEGTVVYVNDAFLKHATKVRGQNIRREDRIGRHVREFISESDEHERRRWLELYARVLEEGEPVLLQEFFLCSRSDLQMYLDVRMSPIKGEEGGVVAAVVTWEDVTDRVNARGEDRRRTALDRVRAEVFGMRRTGDIDKVLTAIYRELRNVAVTFDDCSINLANEGTEPPEFASYCISSESVWVVATAGAEACEQIERMRRLGEPVYRRDLDREDVYGEGKYMDEVWGKRIRSVIDVPFSEGTLAINSVRPEAFSERDIDLLRGFAEVLSEGYTRLEDIQRIEESERVLRRRAALDQVRMSVYRMRETKDIQGVLSSLYEALRGIGVKFDQCSVQIVDEEQERYESYNLGPDWVQLMINREPLTDSTVYEVWRDKRVFYRPDLDEDNPHNEKALIRGAYGKAIRSVLDVPFSHGTLAINSIRPEAFSEADIEILEQFAGVLSEAYTRFEDIRRIEGGALDRIRVSVYEMREAAEIQNVLVSLYETLKDTVMEFDNCSVQIVNEEEERFVSYSIGPDQVELTIEGGSLRDSAVYHAWQGKRAVYRRDLDSQDIYDDRRNIRKKGVRSVLDVPFSHGTIGINSMRPGAFSEEDIQRLGRFAGVLSEAYTRLEDITERNRAQEQLERYAAELERSNEDLQRFAYVASHDLQEPLRMVTSYVQLLERRYKGELDADADEFIGYAVDGAVRMQTLLNDLLAYSRVGTHGRPFESTDCGALLDETLIDLKVAIEESGAEVTREPLPTVQADTTQLGQVFQNLIGNAIKFRSTDERPKVYVGAVRRKGEWAFAVRDNGIGIDPEQAERIFLIFQRLHTRNAYAGTGIGLAICKKIVERHGGRIWVESESGKGTTFHFTIPDREEVPGWDRRGARAELV